jgi:hypothetical protein
MDDVTAIRDAWALTRAFTAGDDEALLLLLEPYTSDRTVVLVAMLEIARFMAATLAAKEGQELLAVMDRVPWKWNRRSPKTGRRGRGGSSGACFRSVGSRLRTHVPDRER